MADHTVSIPGKSPRVHETSLDVRRLCFKVALLTWYVLDNIDEMMREREPRQVAKRAMILSALAFRSSLEVTAHPRAAEIARRLHPWLADVGCGDELDPFEREQLATPIGQLSDSQMIDVKWAGEGAALLCWMLTLGSELEETIPADPSILPTFRSVLKPEAVDIIGSALLRNRDEIEATCRQIVLILSMLRESRVGAPASDIIRRVHVQELSSVGVAVTEDATRRAAGALDGMTPHDRTRVAGLYNVRHHVAMWFLSDRTGYFGPITR